MKTKTTTQPAEKYQSIVFELTDGSLHRFTGKAFTKQKENRRIIFESIRFTKPKKLPTDCKWGEI